MLNTIGLTALIAVLALSISIWSCAHSWRLRSKFLKWGGVAVAAVLAVGLSSVSALTMVGMVKQHARKAPVPDLTAEATPERIARGKALTDSFCSACHSKTGTLTGGGDVSEDLPVPIGSGRAPQSHSGRAIKELVGWRNFSRNSSHSPASGLASELPNRPIIS